MTLKPRQRSPLKKPRTWSGTLGLFTIGSLLMDLATYFGFAWYAFPFAALGLFLVYDSVPRKLGIWKTEVGSLIGTVIGMVILALIKISDPEALYTWQEINTPLKWVLP